MKRPLKDVWITTFCIKISPSIQRLVLGRARIQASGFPGRKTMWPSLMTWWQRVNEGSTLYVAAVLRSAMRDAYPSHSYSVVVWHLKCSSLAPRDFPGLGNVRTYVTGPSLPVSTTRPSSRVPFDPFHIFFSSPVVPLEYATVSTCVPSQRRWAFQLTSFVIQVALVFPSHL